MLKKTIISIFVIGVLGSATLVGLSIHNAADKTINFSNASSHVPKPQQTTNSSIQAPKDLASTIQQTEQQAQAKAAQESARAKQDQAIAAQDALNAQNIAAQNQANYNSAEQQLNQSSTVSIPTTPSCNTTAEAQDATNYQNQYNQNVNNTKVSATEAKAGYSPPYPFNVDSRLNDIAMNYAKEQSNLTISWANEMMSINCTNPAPNENG